MLASIINYLKNLTIEPAIFLFEVGKLSVEGTQIQTDLLMWKLCTKDLNFPESICRNLTLEENDDFEIQVQKKLQDFQMVGQWISSVPMLLYAFFMGSFSDKFGRRKPLMIIPKIGELLSTCLFFVNYKFIDELPTQFFYAFHGYQFFGGFSMFFLGAYAYASDISDEKCKLI